MLLLIAALLSQPAAVEKTCPDGRNVGAADECVTPANQRSPVFRLFFDSGSSEIRREWEEEIDRAVARFPGPRTTFRVDAYSDTPGSPGANLRIAAARADVVVAGLRKRGIANDHISVRVLGERDLLVPTTEGVREVQNRRVEILAFP
jgi:outer membrane protein OmpA-like peptidoglycan-associated protein